MKPLTIEESAWHESFIVTKDKWLRAWRKMRDDHITGIYKYKDGI